MSSKPSGAAKPVGGLMVGGKPRGAASTTTTAGATATGVATRLSGTVPPPARQNAAPKASRPGADGPAVPVTRVGGVPAAVPLSKSSSVGLMPLPPTVAVASAAPPPLQPKKNTMVGDATAAATSKPTATATTAVPQKGEPRAIAPSATMLGNKQQVAAERSCHVAKRTESLPATRGAQSLGKPAPAATAAAPTVVWVPEARPFPDPLPPNVVKLLDGTRLEMPFTTESFKEFPSRGTYCCVRCRSPIAAATSKIPCEHGISGFQYFNVAQCRVGIFTTSADVDDVATMQLHVHCKVCGGFMGILSQDIPSASSGLCVSGEVLRVNSACLHFVDTNGEKTVRGAVETAGEGLLGNYFVQQPREGRSSTERSTPQRGGASPVEDTDDDDDLLNDTDFDDLDVIGTDDGAVRAVERRKAQTATWRQHLQQGQQAPFPAANAGGGAAVQHAPGPTALSVATATKAVTSSMRHSRVAEVVNCHSESESEASSDSDDDSTAS